MAEKSGKHEAQSTDPERAERMKRHVEFLIERKTETRRIIREMVKGGAIDPRVVAYLVELGWEAMLGALTNESNRRMIDRVHRRALDDRDERLAAIGCVGVIHRVHGKAHDDFRELEAKRYEKPVVALTKEQADRFLSLMSPKLDVFGDSVTGGG